MTGRDYINNYCYAFDISKVSRQNAFVRYDVREWLQNNDFESLGKSGICPHDMGFPIENCSLFILEEDCDTFSICADCWEKAAAKKFNAKKEN